MILTNSQFKCRPEPEPYDPETRSDIDFGIYMDRLQSAGNDCRDQLVELKGVLEVQGAVITDVLIVDKKEDRGFPWFR